MDYILAVIDWVENTLIPSFFNPSNLPGRDDEFSPAPFVKKTIRYAYGSEKGSTIVTKMHLFVLELILVSQPK